MRATLTVAYLEEEEYPNFYAPYVKACPLDQDIMTSLEKGQAQTVAFFQELPAQKLLARYALDKWTPLEILGHLIDTERVFAYRALRLARNDKTQLPGFEQDDFVRFGEANSRSLNSLVEEYQAVRSATITLFQSFYDEQLLQRGVASGHTISVRAIGFITIGHEIHHINIIKERYL